MALPRLLLIATLIFAAPVGAEEVGPQGKRLLWCASAFNWLARDADDVGDAVGAEILDAWTDLFTERAMDALRETGLEATEIEAAVAASDLEVLEEMQAKAMRYDVEDCPELEGE